MSRFAEHHMLIFIFFPSFQGAPPPPRTWPPLACQPTSLYLPWQLSRVSDELGDRNATVAESRNDHVATRRRIVAVVCWSQDAHMADRPTDWLRPNLNKSKKTKKWPFWKRQAERPVPGRQLHA
ncbi:hypothetical protein K461DRAFT_116314 [Myriangium duriaei CBS 260.36]|uniref:Secreted protein n=1 Tax=Myriangium duriaei CBS 260.36 TaxID=1168546 RepID=A0A9P4MNK1_9PEZI|nr:hypothetical protein K461DRAFT_116314 [Myriangium duriaei CBS 260.36]